MTTLKEFEDALREQGMRQALAILERLRARDRAQRSIAPARRITGRKMTPELAQRILELHATTGMTQQEIAFQLGVNQGRVNEVIKRGKWLSDNPDAPEKVARDKALARARQGVGQTQAKPPGRRKMKKATASAKPGGRGRAQAQLPLLDF
jgi:hypothetical protein